jgi:Tfp pilus assembly protein PilO
VKQDLKSQIVWYSRTQLSLAATLLVLVAGFGLLGLHPATTRLTTILARVAQQRSELHAAQLRAATLPDVEQETAELRDRVGRFEQKLPLHQDLPELIGDVTQISRRMSLSKLEWRPEPTFRKTDQFTEVPIDFTFQGDFLGVFNFLSQIEDMQRLTRLRKLDVQAKDGLDGQVEVQLTMNIYFSEE